MVSRLLESAQERLHIATTRTGSAGMRADSEDRWSATTEREMRERIVEVRADVVAALAKLDAALVGCGGRDDARYRAEEEADDANG